MKKESLIGTLIIVVFIFSALLTQSPSKQTQDHSPSPSLFAKNGIAIIDINGPISFPAYSSTVFPAGADLILSQLTEIKKDSHVKGLLVRINSPGGTVGASQEIYNAIKTIKTERNIPVIAQIGDVGASGGYYAALGCDTIFANPGSLVGSIGVILGNISIEDLSEKYGIDYEVYKSGPYKDLLSMWRNTNADEADLLQTLVNNVHEQFKNAFMQSRQLSAQNAATLAQGQIFTGEQALNENIIDQLGGYQDALIYIGNKAGLGDSPHIITKYKSTWSNVVNLLNNEFSNALQNTLNPLPSLR